MQYSWYSKYIYVKKTIPHRDCSEMGAISKYVSNIVFFVRNIKGKSYFLHLISNLKKKKNTWNFEKIIYDICMDIVFIVVSKQWGSPLKYWIGYISNFENM